MSNSIGQFDINGLVSKFDDFARGYLFYCTITRPGGEAFFNDHQYLVNAASLPAETIEEIIAEWQGFQYKVGSVGTYVDYTVTFKMDTAGELRKAFLRWKNEIHNPETNHHGSPSDYVGTLSLQQLNGVGEPFIQYDLIGAWPSEIAPVALDYTDKSFATFEVTFKYLYHTVNEDVYTTET